jgi:hypothetical protein
VALRTTVVNRRLHSLTQTGPGYRGADSAMRAFQPLDIHAGFSGKNDADGPQGLIRVRKLESHVAPKRLGRVRQRKQRHRFSESTSRIERALAGEMEVHISRLRCGAATDTHPNRRNPDSDTCSETLRHLRPTMLRAGSMSVMAIYRQLILTEVNPAIRLVYASWPKARAGPGPRKPSLFAAPCI